LNKMGLDFDYMGNAYMRCDNDHSMGRSVLGGGGGCFKGKATKEVKIDHGGGFDVETLNLCNSCAIKISMSARKHGYKVTIKKLKKMAGGY